MDFWGFILVTSVSFLWSERKPEYSLWMSDLLAEGNRLQKAVTWCLFVFTLNLLAPFKQVADTQKPFLKKVEESVLVFKILLAGWRDKINFKLGKNQSSISSTRLFDKSKSLKRKAYGGQEFYEVRLKNMRVYKSLIRYSMF